MINKIAFNLDEITQICSKYPMLEGVDNHSLIKMGDKVSAILADNLSAQKPVRL